jgi:hypothetical protein
MKDYSIEMPFTEHKCGTFISAAVIASYEAVEINRA